MKTISCDDSVILNQWHPISSLDVLHIGNLGKTVLLDSMICFQLNGVGDVSVWLQSDIL